MAPNPGAAIAADKPNVEDDPLAGAVRSDPKSTPMPAGLLNANSLAAPAGLLSSHAMRAPQSLIGVVSVPPVATPADAILARDEPRFISRQALGGPGSQIPIASLPFASDGLFGGETPFAGQQEELGWTTDDIEGIPNGLPNLVRALFGDPAPPPSETAVETPFVAPQTPEDVAVADLERSDVFALPDLDEDPDWSDEDEDEEAEDSELPDDPPTPKSHRSAQISDDSAALRAEIDNISQQRWVFAGIALVIGLAVGALLS